LSTAENELGVIKAVSASSGEVMIPISWKEMQCPKTKVKEARKCAKPKE
jgi:exosome complex component CSL4